MRIKVYLLLLLVQLELTILLLQLATSASGFKPTPTINIRDVPLAKTGCSQDCAGILIPYPFGIGPNCSFSDDYEILCNTSSDNPNPILRKLGLEVMRIEWATIPDFFDNPYGLLSPQVVTVKMPPKNICGGGPVSSLDLRGTPYRFSTHTNEFMVEGCSGFATLNYTDRSDGTGWVGCAPVCPNNNNNNNNSEMSGCRQYFPDLMQNLDFYQISLQNDSSNTSACNGVVAASLIDRYYASEYSGNFSRLEPVPTALVWNSTGVQVNKFANCSFSILGDWYCRCSTSNVGNPYHPDGCEDAVHGTNKRLIRGLIIGLSIGIGVPLLLLFAYYNVKQDRDHKRKAKYFKRNGGLLLQQKISSKENVVEKPKIFTVSELEKATKNFNKDRIIGQGGQGTVYKGIMPDGKVVAIKKSKKVDESQLEEFINEVVILSQVNHQNVVKLLGCCLETEVPLVVYEFIPNGTLYSHIQNPNRDFRLTWKMRLQIATESASALASLHSSSYPPIYHKDIKSSNILLDEKYGAKVADFGISRAISIDQTHVTTAVLFTYGYLDPEFFQSNQFTEKSDVYSFGVVLVELITGRKPVCPTNDGGWVNLASEFLAKMERSNLFEILDKRAVNEGNEEEFMGIAELARRCLEMNGKARPTMKEVAMELEMIRSRQLAVVAGAQTSNAKEVPESISIDVEPPISNSF